MKFLLPVWNRIDAVFVLWIRACTINGKEDVIEALASESNVQEEDEECTVCKIQHTHSLNTRQKSFVYFVKL